MFGFLKKFFGSVHDRLLNKYRKIVYEVNQWDEKYKLLSDDQIKAKTEEYRKRNREGESLDQLLLEAYGLVKNACRRLSGTEIHVSGYDRGKKYKKRCHQTETV